MKGTDMGGLGAGVTEICCIKLVNNECKYLKINLKNKI